MFILLGIVYVESIKPKEINWFPSYDAKHKIPYGTYVLHQEMASFFTDKKVRDVYQSPYVFLKDSTNAGTYFFVDGKLNFGEEEFNELLKFAARGNNVCVADLVVGLKNKIVLGACLDVLEYETKSFETISSEGLPEDFKYLAQSDKVILSPHVAGWTQESYVKLSSFLADKIERKFS